MKVILKFGTFVFLSVSFIFIVSCKKEKQSSRLPVAVSDSINKPPKANAGSDQTVFLPTDTAELNGTASVDPDGSIIQYRWTKLSGDRYSIMQPNAAKAIIKLLVLGEYIFQLEVTDNKGAISKDTVKVIVKDNPAALHSIKALVLEFGSGLPVAGARLMICTSLTANNTCAGNYLSLVTDAKGECSFQANQFRYGWVEIPEYWQNIFEPCFVSYFRNDTLLDFNDYTADSFVVRIVPKTDFSIHIIDSSLRGPLVGNYLWGDVSFNACSVLGVLGANLRRGIDTIIRFHGYYGNCTYTFTVGYEPDDGGFPMNVLTQKQGYIAKGNNTTLRITY